METDLYTELIILNGPADISQFLTVASCQILSHRKAPVHHSLQDTHKKSKYGQQCTISKMHKKGSVAHHCLQDTETKEQKMTGPLLPTRPPQNNKKQQLNDEKMNMAHTAHKTG